MLRIKKNTYKLFLDFLFNIYITSSNISLRQKTEEFTASVSPGQVRGYARRVSPA